MNIGIHINETMKDVVQFFIRIRVWFYKKIKHKHNYQRSRKGYTPHPIIGHYPYVSNPTPWYCTKCFTTCSAEEHRVTMMQEERDRKLKKIGV